MSKWMLSAFADEIADGLDEQIFNLNKHGITHMEFRNLEQQCIIDYKPAQVKEIAKKLAGNGIGVSAIGSPIGKIKITQSFESHLDAFRRTLEVAHLLNAPYIRMFSFFIPPGEDPACYREEVLSRWQTFIDIARGEQLILLHENEKEIYGDRPERCLDLLTTLNCSYLKAIFDPANFVQCDVETYPKAYELLKDHIVYMHIKDARNSDHVVVPAGQGDGHIVDILKALKAMDFNGFLSIEPHLNGSLPGGGPKLFSVAVHALKNILDKL